MNLAYLGKPELERLWTAARKTWERNGDLRGEARIGPLTEAEASELDGLLTWLRTRPRAGAQLKVPLVKLDERLRQGELAASLQAVLEALGGPLRDLPRERMTAASAWEQMWAEAGAHSAAQDPGIQEWLAQLRASGGLKRTARGHEQEALTAVLNVLETLPRAGLELSRLASEVLGDAHALDFGTSVGTLATAAMASRAGQDRPMSASAWREQWANAGILCDALSCNVLALGLRPLGDAPISKALRLLSDAGEPAVITLRQLSREPFKFEPQTVFICENPAVVSAVAEFGAPTRPIVCGGGWPNTAVRYLLEALTTSACELRYHGDFDDEGVQISEHFRRRYNTKNWRFDTPAYRKGLERRGALPLHVAPDAPEIADAIRAAGVAVYEEDVVETLINDLAVGRPSASPARLTFVEAR